jgi:NTP pyrophosphatase (non-canonical NTP hydrolase)
VEQDLSNPQGSPAATMLTLAAVQREVDGWIQRFEVGYFPPMVMLARLTEEVGELAREVNHAYGPKPKKVGEAPGSVAEELGDVLFVVASMANAFHIDLAAAFRTVMQKYQERDAARWALRAPEESDG